ncbi:MAG TPA: hypothetical protein VMR70_03355, partial [Flavisolibacter sp.]|nr:hypothetical protein [Flavisolibacter sp.]
AYTANGDIVAGKHESSLFGNQSFVRKLFAQMERAKENGFVFPFALFLCAGFLCCNRVMIHFKVRS